MDLEEESITRLARNRRAGFTSPQISPDGTLVATSIWRTSELFFRDAANGALVASVDFSANPTPEAWVGNDRLIASAYSNEIDHVLFAVSVDRLRGTARVRKLISHQEVQFVAWLR